MFFLIDFQIASSHQICIDVHVLVSFSLVLELCGLARDILRPTLILIIHLSTSFPLLSASRMRSSCARITFVEHAHALLMLVCMLYSGFIDTSFLISNAPFLRCDVHVQTHACAVRERASPRARHSNPLSTAEHALYIQTTNSLQIGECSSMETAISASMCYSVASKCALCAFCLLCWTDDLFP